MAKQKIEKSAEETVEVDLGEEKKETLGLTTVEPPDIEVREIEGEVVEEEEPEEEAPKTPVPDPSLATIADGFQLLREELRERRETTTPVASPVDDEKEIWENIDTELFKEGGPSKVLKTAIEKRARKIVEQEVGPLVGSLMDEAFQNAEFRLRNDKDDGPIFTKFEAEVRRTLKTLTPAQQRNPQVLKAVFAKVKSDHVDEIVEMRVASRMAEAPAAAAKPVGARPRTPVGEGGSTVMPEGGKRFVSIPKSEVERLKQRAAELGIDPREAFDRRELMKERESKGR